MYKLLDGQPGFYESYIGDDALLVLRSIVCNSFKNLIYENYLKRLSKYSIENLNDYQSEHFYFDHGSIFNKVARCISANDIEIICKLNFLKKLFTDLSVEYISDEENIGRPNIYWRLVRPDAIDDVGPLHVDSWFWNLGHGRIESNQRRIKIWIPLYLDVGKSGFSLVRNSHLEKFRYGSIYKNGINKPTFDPMQVEGRVELISSIPGTAIIFNDDLIHGGVVGGNKARLSLEFTMVSSKNV